MTKKVGIIGDTHGGSEYGLATPDYVSEHFKNTTDCLMLHTHFNKCRDQMGKLDYLFLMGDLCDGGNRHEIGKGRIVSAEHQVDMMVNLLKTIQGSPKIVAVDGSNYHIEALGLDNEVARRVGAIPSMRGEYAQPTAIIDVEKVRFDLAHFITVSKSSWQYRTTPLAVQLVLARLNKLELTDGTYISARAHAHAFSGCVFKSQAAFSNGCFQTVTPFVKKQSPLNQWDIGAMMITVNGSEYTYETMFTSTAPQIMKC